MARPPLDTDLTVAHRGRILYLRSGGPSFATPLGDTSFPTYGHDHDRVWLYASDEDVTWSRGTLTEASPEARALLSAEALQ